MLTATERTRSAIYSEAAPWIHSIKTAKHNLEKGDTATTFPTRSQTAPQVIHYMLLQGGIFLPSHDKKKKKSAEEETLTLISFWGEKKKKSTKEPISSTSNSKRIWGDAGDSERSREAARRQGDCGRAPFPGSRHDNARTPPPRHSRQL